MLRTQVLQRMVANGWRTLAIFSPRHRRRQDDDGRQSRHHLGQRPVAQVLLVEFDFKRPTLAAQLGLAAGFGSDDALSDKAGVRIACTTRPGLTGSCSCYA